ncbi:hypothetical protein [Legionella fallonii]|uniref:Rhs family protein n=1 Tax=Legionella fallonii LLAP-10 TaxID=1212491 RepID=A0A098G469_9GAMM|nr:hypothetical protein [Legionella fallonii]CEG56771.1 protein of unknown function [Legionella fallonii LLAP-10]
MTHRDTRGNLTHHAYDAAGNLTDMELHATGQRKNSGYTLKHHYSHELWDNYLQSVDDAMQINDAGGTSSGRSRRLYDENGQLRETGRINQSIRLATG